MTHTASRPLLLLEINEVPWRLVDAFLADGRYPNLRQFFAAARTFTTVSDDEGELSPWQTWPSLHRGMRNTEHGAMFLGQDVSTFRGVPIWEEFRRRGLPVGICGSMQSWPPVDPGAGGFYVPDTFAADERCIPTYVEPLQRFNLDQVRTNGRVVRRGIGKLGSLGRTAIAAARCGVSRRTIGRVAFQLAGELRDRRIAARRPVFQGLLFWDVFKSLYRVDAPPAFATFFTNHVASIMHRYWDHLFPEDFGEQREALPYHRATMHFALSTLDEIVGDALEMRRRNPEIRLVFATSMGQGPVFRDSHEGLEVTVADLPKLLSTLGVASSHYEPRLAMAPQVAARFPEEAHRAEALRRLEGARTLSGACLFSTEVLGDTVSITLVTPRRHDVEPGEFVLKHLDVDRRVRWQDAGISVHEVERGTGYHVPEGVLAIVGRESPRDSRDVVAATGVKQMLMELAEIA